MTSNAFPGAGSKVAITATGADHPALGTRDRCTVDLLSAVWSTAACTSPATFSANAGDLKFHGRPTPSEHVICFVTAD
jgi:hypothetical protein